MAERRRIERKSISIAEEEQVVAPPSNGNNHRRVISPEELMQAVENEQPVTVQEPKPVAILQKYVADHGIDTLIPALMASMPPKHVLLVERLKNDRWRLSIASVKDPVASEVGTLFGEAYWKEVINPDYREWQEMWKPLSSSDKEMLCKKVGAEWVRSSKPNINNMRMAEAYLHRVGIEKYKPQYRQDKDRARIRA